MKTLTLNRYPALIALCISWILLAAYMVYYYSGYVIIWDDFSSVFLTYSYFINHWIRFGELPNTFFYNYCAQPVWSLRWGTFFAKPLLPIAGGLYSIFGNYDFLLYDTFVLSHFFLQAFSILGCICFGRLFIKRTLPLVLLAALYAIPVYWTQLYSLFNVNFYIPWALFLIYRIGSRRCLLSTLALFILLTTAFFATGTYSFFAFFYTFVFIAISLMILIIIGFITKRFNTSYLRDCFQYVYTTMKSGMKSSPSLWVKWIVISLVVIVSSIVIYTTVNEQRSLYNAPRDYFSPSDEAKLPSFQETYLRLFPGQREPRSTRSGFVGFSVLVLALFACVARKDFVTRFFMCCTIVTGIFYCTAFGKWFFSVVFVWIPLLGLFNRLIVLHVPLVLFLCSLAALGFETWLNAINRQTNTNETNALLLRLVIAGAVGCLINLYFSPQTTLFAILPAISFPLLLWNGSHYPAWKSYLAVVVLIIPMCEVVNYGNHNILATSRSEVPDSQMKMLKTISSNKPYTLDIQQIFPYYSAFDSRESVEGEVAAQSIPPTAEGLDFFAYDVNCNAFQGHITIPEANSWSTKQMTLEFHEFLNLCRENPMMLKEIWQMLCSRDATFLHFYTDALWLPSKENTAQAMSNPWFSFNTLLLQGDPALVSNRTPYDSETYLPIPSKKMNPEPAVQETLIDANEIQCRINMPKPGFALFFLNRGTDWNAWVDGSRSVVHLAYNTFAAIELSQGSHDVRLRYDGIWGGYFKIILMLYTYAMFCLCCYLGLVEIKDSNQTPIQDISID